MRIHVLYKILRQYIDNLLCDYNIQRNITKNRKIFPLQIIDNLSKQPIRSVFSPSSFPYYLVLIFNLATDRTAEIKESLFEELMKKQKNKKVYSSRCDLGASIEWELLSEHSMHSDYWHRCYYILFYFSSVP